MVKVVAEVELEEAVADELTRGHAVTIVFGKSPGPKHKLESDHLVLGVAISDAFGENVPDGDEKFAGNGDDGDVGVLVAGETLEEMFPVGRFLDGNPSGLDEDTAEFATATLGDTFATVGLAAGVDTGTEASVANELFGGREAGDVADGGEDSHSGKEAEARELNEEGGLVSPGILSAEAMEFGGDVGELLLDVDERIEVG